MTRSRGEPARVAAGRLESLFGIPLFTPYPRLAVLVVIPIDGPVVGWIDRRLDLICVNDFGDLS